MVQMKDVLRKLRGERDAKQSTIADDLLISRGTYSSYENGITPPTETCIKIADYFDVSLDYLLGLSNERRPAGGLLASKLTILEKSAGDAAPTASEFADLLDAATRYYRAGAPCGDTPLVALRAFLSGLQAAMTAAQAGDGAALIDGANAAVIGALELTKMPTIFYKAKADT